MSTPTPVLDTNRSLREYVDALVRRWKLSLLVGTVLLAAVLVYIATLPNIYRSAATILIQQQEIPSDLVRSTVTASAEQRIQVINQRVMTTSNLLEVMNKFQLYEDDRKNNTLDAVVEGMRGEIEFDTISAEVTDPRNGRPVRTTLAFTVAFENETPVVAQRVANELASLYLNENLRSRRELASETSTFLSDEATRLAAQVKDLEEELATFKEENAGRLPELTALNMQIVERLDREKLELDRVLRSQEQTQIFLRAQLVSLDPTIEDLRSSGGRRYSRNNPGGGVSQQFVDAREQLEAMETEFSSLTGRYGTAHPDVVRMRREITALRKQVGDGATGSTVLAGALEQAELDLADAQQRYSAQHPDVKRLRRSVASLRDEVANEKPSGVTGTLNDTDVPNPAWIDVNARLDATSNEIASLKIKREELGNKLLDYEARLIETPQVERQYRKLARDYEQATTKFAEIRAKQQEAQLAESLETEQKGERFTLIEPPQLPEEPDSPNRPLLASIGGLLSVAIALGLALLLDLADDRVHDSRALTRLTGVPPLVTVPYIDAPSDRHIRVTLRLLLTLLAVTIVSAAAYIVHTQVQPLDVLWFRALNALDLGGVS